MQCLRESKDNGGKKTKKQNILIVHNYYQIPGGEDTVVSNEKKMLEKHGHKVILYSRNNLELNQMSRIRKLVIPITTVFNPKTYKEIKKIIKEEDIEIVHVHNTLNLISPSVYYAAKSMRVPVVQTIHNFRLLCPGATFYRDGYICEDCVQHGLRCAIKHRCYRGSKIQTIVCVVSTCFHRIMGIYGELNYICLTEFNKQKLLELKQIHPEKVYVKPNFVDSEEDCIPEKDREKQFVFAGRLDKLKGIDMLFEAWKQMGDVAPKLVVCGTGPLEEWCKEFIANNEVNIKMLGFVSNTEVRQLFAHSKALILPTRCYEGFPMGIGEAFSVGTPVICPDFGNVGCIVEEGVSGCKFRVDSIEGLKSAVSRCNGMYESTKNEYRKKYTDTRNYEMMQMIYKQISSRGGKLRLFVMPATCYARKQVAA